MQSIYQTTLRRPVRLSGIGLHMGRPARIVINPAGANHGIWFRRTDLSVRDAMVPAAWDAVSDTTMNTCISNVDGVTVSTIEHLMAALQGCGVTNALIDIDGPEVPIMDGSSAPFVNAILANGIVEQNEKRMVLRILKEVSINEGEVQASLVPSDFFEVDFTIEFDAVAIGLQTKRLAVVNGAFVDEIMDSRTFVRNADVAALRENGLALGGSLDNAVVVDGELILNPEGFRHADECVRHKILDAVGDLALAGAPIMGRYTGQRAGHGVTNRLLRKLFSTPGAVRLETCTPADVAGLPGVARQPEVMRRSA
ncbi:UDP-3-O-acyl-N-acetylglucosamine deacetylase [Pontivivens insulae]|uniref:UDP-3-O-acyl-N-acetylglucosamine deacetylase n=1 Tax=Pontivivens insulae TaxID=1639689 RepID=A0A2R8ADF1_9RHOB|nr:UDP-3-O-acyl-N-acetylglucosamine deacetylase [Pontivivens insulae]RED14212.1 UDP-3-O-[3-hydroxymyristoyl] N-acetylglucosamine deacetylase [Pontivivens insulae]SPF30287.1 UDP-3-O-acyl-N-acetylglucosamine deacetylase [Pontivivens insulae]